MPTVSAELRPLYAEGGIGRDDSVFDGGRNQNADHRQNIPGLSRRASLRIHDHSDMAPF
jgi:hypothetical protein